MPKYEPFPSIKLTNRKWPNNVLTEAPRFCSVDLRDGNQALAIPMSVSKKLKMFKLLTEIGFKEIEVGFPSASQIDFDFTRKLIDEKHIPDNTYIQVLTQSREHLINRTVESLQGSKNAIIHLYNSTSALQRKITFKMSKDEIKQIAIDGTKLVKKNVSKLKDTNVILEYSPESFSDTETDYALEVCEAVIDIWEPDTKNKIILNLPETVQYSTPNVYADQVEWFIDNLKHPDKVIISLHSHNDRGTGIASSELAMLAGARRVEGTLFGNGERTGNVDVINLALNMFSDGINPGLNLKDIPYIREVYEECTEMLVPPRHPYAGELVFTAFSGSHQDAIKKGMDIRRDKKDSDAKWEVPYLPIDPEDIGRSYEAIIRINSQSGKGGVAYILEKEYDLEIPRKMQPEIGKIINDYSDKTGKELTKEEIFKLFNENFLNLKGSLEFISIKMDNVNNDVHCGSNIKYNGKELLLKGTGNGPIDSFVDSLKSLNLPGFEVNHFQEQSIGKGSKTEAVSYIQIITENQGSFWGVGKDTSISIAGIKALINALNQSLMNKE